jgi:23S rRNA (guanosine2251-2'-O)-methyltransferase
MTRLNSHQLRKSKVGESHKISNTLKRNPLVLVLDNIQDTYNIGSFFRLADALGAQKVYLCGHVITPPNIKIHRASIGTWKFIPWENVYDTAQCLKKLKSDGFQIVACEQTKTSVDYKKALYDQPIALVAGNEQNGVGESSLNLCDLIVEIPMYGINKSLNTLIATSIIGYEILSKNKTVK